MREFILLWLWSSILSFDSWLPADLLRHCFTITQCKLIILDAERADCVEPISHSLCIDAETKGFIVLHPKEGKGQWKGMQNWDTLLSEHLGDTHSVLQRDPSILPEDNATILFTSGTRNLDELLKLGSASIVGTTGLPKGAVNTQRQFLTNILNVSGTSKFFLKNILRAHVVNSRRSKVHFTSRPYASCRRSSKSHFNFHSIIPCCRANDSCSTCLAYENPISSNARISRWCQPLRA